MSLSSLLSVPLLLGRYGYVSCMSKGATVEKRLALRANSTPYITVGAALTLCAVMFVCLTEGVVPALRRVSQSWTELVIIAILDFEYADAKLVSDILKETRKRMEDLLHRGLGLQEDEMRLFWEVNEKKLLEVWTQYLKTNRAATLTNEEMSEALFDTGIECGKVMVHHFWEGVLHDVAAFMHEWCAETEACGRTIRVLEEAKEALLSRENDAASHVLLCVAVVLANEDADLRRRCADKKEDLGCAQFSAARYARHNMVARNVLHWPDCTSRTSRIQIKSMRLHADILLVIEQNRFHGFTKSVPYSVFCTLVEVIRAGYLNTSPEGKTEVTITFEDGFMIIPQSCWNERKRVQRKALQYVTAGTRIEGDVAFLAERREEGGYPARFDGSCCLCGKLTLIFEGREIKEETSWVERTSTTVAEDRTIWGNPDEFLEKGRSDYLSGPSVVFFSVLWFALVLLGLLQEGIVYLCTRLRACDHTKSALSHSLRI